MSEYICVLSDAEVLKWECVGSPQTALGCPCACRAHLLSDGGSVESMWYSRTVGCSPLPATERSKVQRGEVKPSVKNIEKCSHCLYS